MKRMIFLLGGLFIAANPGFTQGDTLTVGSFNIEWFGHGNNPRTTQQIRMLADYIKTLEADILAVQEIHAKGDANGNRTHDVNELQYYLGADYNMKFGDTGGGQRLGIIWNITRVRIWDFGDLEGISREPAPDGRDTFPRIPVTAFVIPLVDAPDFRLITVHSYFSSDPARHLEASTLAEWVAEFLKEDYDKDVALIGDFNAKSMDGDPPDPTRSQTVINLESLGSLVSISKDHPEFTTPATGERYDQGFLSPDLLNEEYLPGSWDVQREYCENRPDEYLANISNHCPVLFRIYGQDNDRDKIGNLGK